MNVIFADQPLDVSHPSIFLAGPTPRSTEVPSWRLEALAILNGLEFAGTVLVPERRDWSAQFDYMDQVEWEFGGLETCSVIAFWVPRRLQDMPGFTTNVEFGRYVGRKKCVYGRPHDASRTRYLDWLYKKMTGDHPHVTLMETLKAAMEACQK